MRYLQYAALLLAACTGTPDASASGYATVLSAPSQLTWQPPLLVATDSIERAAQRAIAARRPIAAERILREKLAGSGTRTPVTLLLAAEAATLRKAWPEVMQLLHEQSWVDSVAGGYGHLLIARAALEQSPRASLLDSLAASHAERATKHPATEMRGRALLLLGRALDRSQDADGAAKRYLAASDALLTIQDWLILRAAAVTRNASERRSLLSALRDTVARAQSDSVDLAARIRFGDTVIVADAPVRATAPTPPTTASTPALRTLADSVARARTLIRSGKTAAARTILQRVARVLARDDAEAMATALYLLGDISAEQGATVAWRTLWSRYPAHALAARGAFRAGVLAWQRGAVAEAAAMWKPLALATTTESLAARYWLARVDARRGDNAAARNAWQSLVQEAPESYYALLAADRLKTVPYVATRADAITSSASAPAPVADGEAPSPDDDVVDERVSRLLMLESLGLDPEAAAVRRDLLARDAPAQALMSTAVALRREAMSSQAIRLAERARASGVARNDALYRTLFPLPFEDLIGDWSRRVGIDAALVAAVIRQESRFTPTARSGADARGLMQLMPRVGQSLASNSIDRPWALSLLYEPEINIPLGVRHLRDALRSDDGTHPAYALAAYNAGRSRLLRWRALPGALADWELFVEQIPYAETRDYVRIVLRNREWYRALYPSLSAAQ